MASASFEPYVDANVAARHLSITRKQLLRLARRGLIRAYPVDPTRRRKTYRFKLSELEEDLRNGLSEESRRCTLTLGDLPRCER
jgi:hypothetical protein